MRSIAEELNCPEKAVALDGPEKSEYLALSTTWVRFVEVFIGRCGRGLTPQLPTEPTIKLTEAVAGDDFERTL
jgi:hypothetical protein